MSDVLKVAREWWSQIDVNGTQDRVQSLAALISSEREKVREEAAKVCDEKAKAYLAARNLKGMTTPMYIRSIGMELGAKYAAEAIRASSPKAAPTSVMEEK